MCIITIHVGQQSNMTKWSFSSLYIILKSFFCCCCFVFYFFIRSLEWYILALKVLTFSHASRSKYEQNVLTAMKFVSVFSQSVVSRRINLFSPTAYSMIHAQRRVYLECGSKMIPIFISLNTWGLKCMTNLWYNNQYTKTSDSNPYMVWFSQYQ